MKESQAAYKRINKAVVEAVKKLEYDLASPLVLTATKQQVSDKLQQYIEETLGADKEGRYINVDTYILDGKGFETDLDCELQSGHILDITVQVDAFRTFFLICLGSGIRNTFRWDIEWANDISSDLEDRINDLTDKNELTEDFLRTHFTENICINNCSCRSTCENSIFTTDIAGIKTPTGCISMAVSSKLAGNAKEGLPEKYNIKRCFTFWISQTKQGNLRATSLHTKRQYINIVKFELGPKTDAPTSVQAFGEEVKAAEQKVHKSKATKNKLGGFTATDLDEVSEILRQEGVADGVYVEKALYELARIHHLGYDIRKLNLLKSSKALKPAILRELRLATQAGVPIEKVWRRGFRPYPTQLRQYWLAESQHIDLGEYAKSCSTSQDQDRSEYTLYTERQWRLIGYSQDSDEVKYYKDLCIPGVVLRAVFRMCKNNNIEPENFLDVLRLSLPEAEQYESNAKEWGALSEPSIQHKVLSELPFLFMLLEVAQPTETDSEQVFQTFLNNILYTARDACETLAGPYKKHKQTDSIDDWRNYNNQLESQREECLTYIKDQLEQVTGLTMEELLEKVETTFLQDEDLSIEAAWGSRVEQKYLGKIKPRGTKVLPWE